MYEDEYDDEFDTTGGADKINHLLNTDIYGKRYVNDAPEMLELNAKEKERYDDDKYTYEQQMYRDPYESEFIRFLKVSKMTQNCRSMLMAFYRAATSDDVVLGNYTPHEAKIAVETLSLDIEVTRIKLRGQDRMSWMSGAWDTAQKLIITAYKSRLNRAIDGWERTAQITQRTYSKSDNMNEERSSEQERNKTGISSLFNKKR